MRHRAIRVCAGVLFLLAAVANGFAHGPPAAVPDTIDLSAFVLPDGSLPTLCLTGDDGTDHGATYTVCDACRLTAAPGLVDQPDQITGRSFSYALVRFQAFHTRGTPKQRPSRPSQRAPPEFDIE